MKKIILSLLMCVTLFTSCKKDEVEEPIKQSWWVGRYEIVSSPQPIPIQNQKFECTEDNMIFEQVNLDSTIWYDSDPISFKSEEKIIVYLDDSLTYYVMYQNPLKLVWYAPGTHDARDLIRIN